jgi:hypothetical protein
MTSSNVGHRTSSSNVRAGACARHRVYGCPACAVEGRTVTMDSEDAAYDRRALDRALEVNTTLRRERGYLERQLNAAWEVIADSAERLGMAAAALQELADSVERDRREADKILCHAAAARRAHDDAMVAIEGRLPAPAAGQEHDLRGLVRTLADEVIRLDARGGAETEQAPGFDAEAWPSGEAVNAALIARVKIDR